MLLSIIRSWKFWLNVSLPPSPQICCRIQNNCCIPFHNIHELPIHRLNHSSFNKHCILHGSEFREPSVTVSPQHPWRLSYTGFKRKFTGFRIIRAPLGAGFVVPKSGGDNNFLNFKGRPEINFRPEINNGSPVKKTKKQNLPFCENLEIFLMFKDFHQQETWTQSQRNTHKDSHIIYGFTMKWEMCDFLTNLSLHARCFSICCFN